MKTTKIVLGLLTLLCAVGATFAAKLLAPQDTWISGKNLNGQNVCKYIGKVCDPATGNTKNCEVQVTYTGGTQNTIGFSNNICTVAHRTANVTYVVSATDLISVIPYTPN